MSYRGLIAVGVLMLAAAPLRAQEPEQRQFERVDFRVLTAGQGRAIQIDRGSNDGLAKGDTVFFLPQGGGSYKGTVLEVNERDAIVEMVAPGYLPEAGTRGRARVPASRLAPEPEPPPVEPEPQPERDTPDHPPWKNQDPDWTPDKPLLSLMRPVHPKDRGMQVAGRVFVFGDLTQDDSQDFNNSYFRAGTALDLSNPLGQGGAMQFDAEYDIRYETDEEANQDLLLRRASYRHGGHRFQQPRWELGRFLHHAMPEFGILDGFEWSDRTREGHRYGASFGYLPQLDEDFETGRDLQISGFYEWVADPSERFTIQGGYQKSFRDGKTDRDLVVVKSRFLPLEDGWDLHGTVWIDFYYGRDDEKNGGPEITQAIGSARRQWDTQSLDITYRRIRFPETLRREFLPLVVGDLANNRYDRLALTHRTDCFESSEFRTRLAGWDDEDDDGASLEFGLQTDRYWTDDDRIDVTLFGALTQFTNTSGVRIAYGSYGPESDWNVLYELSNHHLTGYENNLDDLLQHRLRGSYSLYTNTGWNLSVYAQLHQWDEELSWSIGFHMQRAFRLRETYL